MSNQPVERDERTVTVENASFRWGYLFVTYALLIDVMVRGWVRHEAAWDLLALVAGGGAICTVYQASRKILARGWVKMAVLAACIAGAIAAIIAMAGAR